ncbi:lipoprotein insertase outer membrane protein LolB [Francisella philomiragia]|uniref:lipoprotein insertase outer membrane protein LolB n=1 Tax=Francisella philomiragia TaxID=28110 RepID=UPI001903766C|nr:lipoprotein insertase outer membrane protein LolB [Francisella philomiragia]MBK2025357.1 outer membrane lipoprotein LolB [Francisella philomiragia]
MQRIMLKSKIDIKLKIRLVLVLIFVSLLVSCTSMQSNVTPIADNVTFDQKLTSEELLQLNKWQAKGVIGIIYNNQAESANYVYAQDGDNFSISLYGPLGIGSVEIKGDADEVSLENSKGQKITAKDAKTLMLEQLGWYVPVDGLKYWIKAVAIPNTKHNTELNSKGLLSKLSQNGWDISYQNYELVDSKYPLPAKIRMTRENLILKIIIKSWQI